LIDRYLIAIGKSGAEPLLCVNKIDLLGGAQELEPLRPYQDLGLTVICCSAATGEGLEPLSDALAEKVCVFAGHSGVGKSSLLNALDPRLHLNTGSVSSANEKGRRHRDRYPRHPRVRTLGCKPSGFAPVLSRVRRLPLRIRGLHAHARAGLWGEGGG
jgi:ribosome small subunit-dependent GTPase A